MVRTPIAERRPAARRNVPPGAAHRGVGTHPQRLDEPVRLRNESDALAAALGGEIIAGVHPPGSRLPNESLLLDRFKVSRPTLREALRALSAKGLIISRQKVGTTVRPKTDWNMLDPDFLAWHLHTALTMEFVSDLFQLRQWLEPQAAHFAAQSGKPEALARIAEAYADMERFKNGSGDLIGADLRFHQAILDATGNPFIGTLGGLIRTALVGSFKRGWRGAIIKDERLHQHRAVLRAIEAREPDSARDQMAKLLQDSIDDVRRELHKSDRSKARVGAKDGLRRHSSARANDLS
ncbi:MAG: FadR/GntR family transcriptional regulator [Roseiarcus sp.]|jgi:DNA-binding FadR family transcriptional regulator